MPKNLNNRLENLEDEIYSLLKLQQQKCSEIQDMVPSYCKIADNVTMVQIERGKSDNRCCSRNQTTRHKKCLKSVSQTKVGADSSKKVCFSYDLDSSAEQPHFCTPNNNPSTTDYSNKYKMTKKKLCNEKEKVQEACRIIEQLKDELDSSKINVASMAKEMNNMTEALQSLRNKYQTIKFSRKDANSKIEEMKQMNVELCRKLDCQLRNQVESIRNIKEKATLEIENKVNQKASLLLNQSQEHHQKLQDANERLAKNYQDFHKKYLDASEEINKLKKELHAQSTQLQAQFRESAHIKSELENEKCKNMNITDGIDQLEGKVKELISIEKKSQQEINGYKSRIRELEQLKQKTNSDYLNKSQEFNAMRCECESTKRKLEELKEDNYNKCKMCEKEIQQLKQEMKDKESVLISERQGLNTIVKELSTTVMTHKNRIKELLDINKQQEALLQSQMVILRSKDEQVRLAEIEAEAIRQKSTDLQEQIFVLKQSLDTFENMRDTFKTGCTCKLKLENLQDDLYRAKVALQEERDKLLIKEKIVEDQADTILNLKNKVVQGKDACKTTCEITKLQRQLDLERKSKDKLLSSVKDMEWNKEQLKNQIALLEKEKVTKIQYDDQMRLLQNLEEQVALKQREWNLQWQVLNKEKDQAVQAAKFATQKLFDTVTDFKFQTESQKKVQVMLTNIVQDKNEKLKCACEQIGHFNEVLRKRSTSEVKIKEAIKCKAKTARKACAEIMDTIK